MRMRVITEKEEEEKEESRPRFEDMTRDSLACINILLFDDSGWWHADCRCIRMRTGGNTEADTDI